MIYFISDLHFFHSNIFKYEPIRKEKFENHQAYIKKIVENWNSVVNKDDEVYIVGDLFVGFNQFKKDLKIENESEKEIAKKILSKLNGKKYLIKGNHDKKTNSWYEDTGIEEVLLSKPLTFNNKNYFLLHYPICDEYTSKSKDLDYLKIVKAELQNCGDFIIIHGHTHSNVWCQNCDLKHFNVSIEQIDFTPISIKDVENKLEKENK